MHGTLGLDYYRQALDHLARHADIGRVLIFTDDPAWGREHLRLHAAQVVLPPNEAKPWDGMHLMARCEHKVIANSSFSWWGAWLGNRGMTVAPQRWFNDPGLDASRIVPAGWVRM